MLSALAEHFPPGFTWSRPEGGVFVWAQGPEGVDTDVLAHECLRRGVAYVPGRYFYPCPGAGLATMRLNYTMADPETIRRAVRIVAEVMGGAVGAPGPGPRP
jgi:2-aminoadipate transaminase